MFLPFGAGDDDFPALGGAEKVFLALQRWRARFSCASALASTVCVCPLALAKVIFLPSGDGEHDAFALWRWRAPCSCSVAIAFFIKTKNANHVRLPRAFRWVYAGLAMGSCGVASVIYLPSGGGEHGFARPLGVANTIFLTRGACERDSLLHV